MQYGDLIGVVVASVASGGATALALIWLVRTWVTERLKASIRNEYALQLEAYKAELLAQQQTALEQLRADNARSEATRSVATASFVSSHLAAHERRLAGIDRLWNSVVRLRSNSAGLVEILDATIEPEYASILEKPGVRDRLSRLSLDALAPLLADVSHDVEQVRPFLSEYVYSLFSAYHTVTGRVEWLAIRDRDKGLMTPWYRDDSIRQILQAVLTSSEMEYFDRLVVGKLSWMRYVMETKMLAEVGTIISGEAASAATLDRTRRIAEATQVAAPQGLVN